MTRCFHDADRCCEIALELTKEEERFIRAQARAESLSFEDFVRREVLRPLSEEELAGVAPTQN